MISMEKFQEIKLTNQEIYQLFLYFQSFDELKRSLVMVLVHLSPKQVTTSQLTYLAGYSRSSKYIFKSKVIEALETEKVIEVIRPYKRLMLIRLHPQNVLLQKFSSLCQQEGQLITENLLGNLLELQ